MANKNILKKYLQNRSAEEIFLHGDSTFNADIIVVIPSYWEPKLFQTLESLKQCASPKSKVAVMVILNYSKDSEEIINFHNNQYKQLMDWQSYSSNPSLQFIFSQPIYLQSKQAGVGLARKIGMDMAVRLFSHHNKSSGIILCLDADCLCHENYLVEVERYFSNPNSKPCVTLGFEHQFDENETAIIEYELHLRYYIEAQKSIGYPFAFHTLGSCMAVRAEAYCLQGGMNKRQAGEDFYFLHKFSVIDWLGKIKKNLVYPSARISTRVPFGTGKAVGDYLQNKIQLTYSLDAIRLFGLLLDKMNDWYIKTNDDIREDIKNLNNDVFHFCDQQELWKQILVCKENCATLESFHKRMMRWFDPFLLMKFLHYLRDFGYPDTDVSSACRSFLKIKPESAISSKELLMMFRHLQNEHQK